MRNFGHLRWLVLALATLMAQMTGAEEAVDVATQNAPLLYVADLALETPEEFSQLLERAEQLLPTAVNVPREEAQVTFVLHGPVLRTLLRENYPENKDLVDRAAALSAMRVIDLQACRTWMSGNGLEDTQLLPFVEPVDYAPKALRALVRDEGRVYF